MNLTDDITTTSDTQPQVGADAPFAPTMAGFVLLVLGLIMIACAPAVVIAVWGWAL